MMKNTIWNGALSVDELNALNASTLGNTLGIHFTEIGNDYLKATMPVDTRTKQPFGLLHGGASVALAETMGSVASWACVNRDLFIGVGVEINANHIKAVTEDVVTGICKPLHVKGKLHVWEIKIYNAQNELSCISRLTCMVIPKK
jgi:1,4-dihydroxy-2-naphthoyl-CoA hydrolase